KVPPKTTVNRGPPVSIVVVINIRRQTPVTGISKVVIKSGCPQSKLWVIIPASLIFLWPGTEFVWNSRSPPTGPVQLVPVQQGVREEQFAQPPGFGGDVSPPGIIICSKTPLICFV